MYITNSMIFTPVQRTSPSNQNYYRLNQMDEKMTQLEMCHEKAIHCLLKQNEEIQDKVNQLLSRYVHLSSVQRSTRQKLQFHKQEYKKLMHAIDERMNNQQKRNDEKISDFHYRQKNSQNKLSHLVYLQNSTTAVIEQEIIPLLEMHEKMFTNIFRDLSKQEAVIQQQLVPFVTDFEKKLEKPILNLLSRLSSGSKVSEIVVNGTKILVCRFVNYNLFTNVSTFLMNENHVLAVDSDKINSISFP